jgi:hypothetical protein
VLKGIVIGLIFAEEASSMNLGNYSRNNESAMAVSLEDICTILK